jgi:hypothetical protein
VNDLVCKFPTFRSEVFADKLVDVLNVYEFFQFIKPETARASCPPPSFRFLHQNQGADSGGFHSSGQGGLGVRT